MSINLERLKALKSFSFLWKTENEDWLLQRKSDWRTLQNSVFTGHELEDIKRYMTYFLYGTRDAYIHASIIYLLTPLDNKNQADDFFFSDVLTDADRYQIVTGGYGVDIDLVDSESLPFVRKYIKSFVEWRRGGGVGSVSLKNEVCYRPDDFVQGYLSYSFNLYLKRQKYSPSLDLLDYFLKSFPLLQDKKIIESIKSRDRVAELIDWSVDILKDKKATSAMKEHANQLLDNRDEIEAIWNKVSSDS